MTESSYSSVIHVLNECIAQFFSVDENDLASLGAILAKLDEILDDKTLPEEFTEKVCSFNTELGNAMLEGTTSLIISEGPPVLTDFIKTLDPETTCSELADLSSTQKNFAQENIAVELERIEELEDLLLDFEHHHESSDFELLHRIMHSLKGDFGVLGLGSLVALTHKTEDIINNTDADSVTELIPMLLGYKDLMSRKIHEVLDGVFVDITLEEKHALLSYHDLKRDNDVGITKILEVSAEEDLLVEFITEGKEHVAAAESSLIELENDPGNDELINAAFRSCHTIKGVAGFMNLKPLQEFAHALENIMDSIRIGTQEISPELYTLLLSGFDNLGELVKKVEDLLPSGSCEISDEIAGEYLKLLEFKEKSLQTEEEVMVADVSYVDKHTVSDHDKVNKVSSTEALGKVPEIISKSEQDAKSAAQSFGDQNKRKKTRVEETVRVSVGRLDRLIDSIGEIVIAQSMLTADPDFIRLKSRSIEQKATQISMVMRQIQEEAMSLRMVSLKSTFQKMSRLVRDLSQKMSKPINFKITGEDTELDKSIIEHIGDPLVHMLRNSVDHGLESEEERVKTDKSKIGEVELSAYHKSGNVVIDIVDDGRGLSKSKLLKKAVENGIADPNRDYSDQEVFQFIFAPGFSTANEITDVSGRGVGMDVVKRNIIEMRGNLEITSEEGKGTCFSIKLPLTMAIIDGMVVSVGDETLILPTLSIITSVNPQEGQIQSVRGKGEMLHLHDRLYRFVRLSDVLGIDAEKKEPSEGIAILIENISGKRIVLWVDAIVKKQQVVIKSMGELFQKYKWISGGAVLGDGKVNLILDVNELFLLMEK